MTDKAQQIVWFTGSLAGLGVGSLVGGILGAVLGLCIGIALANGLCALAGTR